MTRPKIPSADLERRAHDTALCPKGCGDLLAFSSDPMTGQTIERCWGCDAAWRVVVPTLAEPRSLVSNRTTLVARKRLVISDRLAVAREALRQALPRAAHEARPVGEVVAMVGGRNTAAVRRVFGSMRRAGEVAERRVGVTILVWRVVA